MLEDEPIIPMVIQYSPCREIARTFRDFLNTESNDAIADMEQFIMIRFGQVN
jgi:hypothetical protein